MTPEVRSTDARFAPEAIAWMSRFASPMVTVVLKVTYDLRAGRSVVAAQQEPVLRADRHWGDEAQRSLYAPSDLVPVKESPEVLVVGHAYAPPGTSVPSLEARIGVGTWSKGVRVHGDRVAGWDGRVSPEQPFTSMPLVYERSRGGPATWNPVGLSARPMGGVPSVPVPNVLPIDGADRPAGLGPIAAWWPPRQDFVGTEAPQLEELAQAPLPKDLGNGYFQSALADQRIESLEGDLDLSLWHLHEEDPRFTTVLPGFRASAMLPGTGRTTQPHPLRPDTLWIFTDRALATVTYRAGLSVDARQLTGPITIEVELVRVPATPFSRGSSASPADKPTPSFEAAAPVQPALRTQKRTYLPNEMRARKEQDPGEVTQEVGSMAVARPVAPFVRPGSAPLDGSAPATAAPASAPEAVRPPVAPPAAPPLPPRAPPAVVQRPAPAAWGGTALPYAVEVAMREASARGEPPPTPSGPSAPGPVLASALDASNRAADAEAPARVTTTETRSAEGADDRAGLALLWFEAGAARRLRARDAWKKILRKAEERDPDPQDTDSSTVSVEERRDFVEVLRLGKPDPITSLDALLRSAAAVKGRFVAPLALCVGRVRPDFDERAACKAYCAAGKVFAKGDAELTAAIEEGAALAADADPLTPSSDFEAARVRVLEAFLKKDRGVPTSELDERAERALIERRAFKVLELRGEKHVRARLVDVFEASLERVLYLPQAAAAQLPLARSIAARAVVEVVPAEEPALGGKVATRAIAVSRRLELD